MNTMIKFAAFLILGGATLVSGGCKGTVGFGLDTDVLTSSMTQKTGHPDMRLGTQAAGEDGQLVSLGGLGDSPEFTAWKNLSPGDFKALGEKYKLTDPAHFGGFLSREAAAQYRVAENAKIEAEKASTPAEKEKLVREMYAARKSAVDLERARIASVLSDIQKLESDRSKVATDGTFSDTTNDPVLQRYAAWRQTVQAQHDMLNQNPAPTGLETWTEFNVCTIAKRLRNGESVRLFDFQDAKLASK